jgi:hypothetical protein
MEEDKSCPSSWMVVEVVEVGEELSTHTLHHHCKVERDAQGDNQLCHILGQNHILHEVEVGVGVEEDTIHERGDNHHNNHRKSPRNGHRNRDHDEEDHDEKKNDLDHHHDYHHDHDEPVHSLAHHDDPRVDHRVDHHALLLPSSC